MIPRSHSGGVNWCEHSISLKLVRQRQMSCLKIDLMLSFWTMIVCGCVETASSVGRLLTEGEGHDLFQHERTVGMEQSHTSAILKHCSHKETSGQQSPHSEEHRSFGRKKTATKSTSLATATFLYCFTCVVANRDTVEHKLN